MYKDLTPFMSNSICTWKLSFPEDHPAGCNFHPLRVLKKSESESECESNREHSHLYFDSLSPAGKQALTSSDGISTFFIEYEFFGRVATFIWSGF
jgi:hypothetical protein